MMISITFAGDTWQDVLASIQEAAKASRIDDLSARKEILPDRPTKCQKLDPGELRTILTVYLEAGMKAPEILDNLAYYHGVALSPAALGMLLEEIS